MVKVLPVQMCIEQEHNIVGEQIHQLNFFFYFNFKMTIRTFATFPSLISVIKQYVYACTITQLLYIYILHAF